MESKQAEMETILRRAPVVPVLVVEDAAIAVDLARALVAGGLPAIEITLRTGAALEAIRAVAESVEGAIAGAGTVKNAAQFEAAVEAGSRFVVSPGATPLLIEAAMDMPVPLLPGSASASEAMLLLEHGYRLQKFFPAGAAGGAPYLASLSSPLAEIRFCPTGGVSTANAGDYLRLANVICVGGSWVAPKDHVAAGRWDAIEDLARAAAALDKNQE